MSENLKTIRELADELGVSKKKIHYQVSKLDSNLIQRLDGTIYLGKTAISKIKSSIGYSKVSELDTLNIQNRHELDSRLDTEKNELINEKSEQISYLKEQLNKKDGQLAIKDGQIKSLVEIQNQTQNLLDQQQRLALQDKKLLEEYKEEIKGLKSLAVPLSDKNEVDLTNDREQIERLKADVNFFKNKLSKIEEQQEVERHSKKWWHFFGNN